MALRIMVVDDEPVVLKLIKTMVEQLGCEVLAISDSREAAQQLNTDKFDGILLDANMPHLSGFAVAQGLRSSRANSNVPVAMLTGESDIETMRKAFAAGITFFLNKPVNRERLHALVRAMHGAMLRERRRYSRLPYRAKATCTLQGNRFEAQTVNVSEGGILLAGSGGARVGDELFLEFSLPQAGSPLRMRAKVVRKEAPDRVALCFLEMEPQYRMAIHGYISGNIKG